MSKAHAELERKKWEKSPHTHTHTRIERTVEQTVKLWLCRPTLWTFSCWSVCVVWLPSILCHCHLPWHSRGKIHVCLAACVCVWLALLFSGSFQQISTKRRWAQLLAGGGRSEGGKGRRSQKVIYEKLFMAWNFMKSLYLGADDGTAWHSQ